MADIVVFSTSTSGEEKQDPLEGDVWEVHEGVLHVLDGIGHVVASYAPGKWVSVLKT
jgi:hypothetical protein